MSESGVPGVRVGHVTNDDAMTGCTVVRFDLPNVASGEVRGGAPATREFALLDPRRMVSRLDAIVLTGGSAFGLAAVDGVMVQLANEGVGFETQHGRVPIVVGMAIYDLGVGDASVRPDAAEGRRALAAAHASFEIGRVGAGTGATIGKWRGSEAARPGGLGAFSVRADDVVVGAIVVANAAGDLASEEQGSGTTSDVAAGTFQWPAVESPLSENTTIAVIVTNALLDKTGCRSLAEAGHDGLARAIVPAHTPADGDAIVAVSCGNLEAPLPRLRLMASTAIEKAIASIRVQ